MARRSRSPQHRRPRYANDRDDSFRGFSGRDDKARSYVDNAPGDRDIDRQSDRNCGYGGRDVRRREYDERERDKERNRDRERYSERARERDRADRPRRSASPSGPSRARSVRSRSRSRSGSKSGPPVDKSKPNFAPSGLLAAATNVVKAVDGTSTVLKYNEPPEARKPILGWRLYVFKGSEQVGESFSWLFSGPDDRLCHTPELLHIHRQSAYLIGRDKTVADISIDHPSCSKQHAVIQCELVLASWISFILYCHL
jgi:smad nuclear-interacting protein 1